MRKLMLVVRRPDGADPDDIHERCRQLPAIDGLAGWIANVADVSQDPIGGGTPTVEAVVSVYLHGDRGDAPLTDDVAAALLPGLDPEIYEVEERLMWDRHGDWPVGERAPGFNRVALVPRLPSLTHDEFARHWTERHGPIAVRHHPGIARYVQNIVTRTPTGASGATEWDGIAELHFVRTEDFVEHMYDTPEGKEIVREDVRRFIDPSRGERFLLGRWTILQIDDGPR